MRSALLSIMFLALLFTTQATAATLALDVDAVEAGFDPATQSPILTISLKQQSKIAVGEFSRIRVGESVTMRLGDKPLITSIIRDPILQGTLTIGGWKMPDEDVGKIARDIKSGERILFIDGSDK